MLKKVGFENNSIEDFEKKNIVLRDGRNAVLWVNKQSGHGILDPEFWESEDYYTEDYRKEFSSTLGQEVSQQEHLDTYKDLNQKQFDTFSNHLTKETKYLEIGCSFGGVFNLVSAFGVSECHGVEPNRKDAAFTSKNNPNAKIFNVSMDKVDLPAAYYDIIVSNEVLEHTVNPKAFLKKCNFLLRYGGVLHLETPNHNDVLLSTYRNTGYDNFYYHKAHIHYFTVSSLKQLCQECGFGGEVSSFLMYPLFNQVWWHQNKCPQPSAKSALSTPVPANNDNDAGNAINNFYKHIEKEYEDIINSKMLGDCIIYQGRKI